MTSSGEPSCYLPRGVGVGLRRASGGRSLWGGVKSSRPVIQQGKDIDLWKEEVRESRDQCGGN